MLETAALLAFAHAHSHLGERDLSMRLFRHHSLP